MVHHRFGICILILDCKPMDLESYQKGVVEGMKHQKPSDETLTLHEALKNELAELKKEWDEMKSRIFVLFLGSAAVLVGYGVWVGTIQSFMNEHSRWAEKIDVRIVDMDKRQQISDVNAAEIKTKLIGIETTLIEIKQALKIK